MNLACRLDHRLRGLVTNEGCNEVAEPTIEQHDGEDDDDGDCGSNANDDYRHVVASVPVHR